MQETPFLVHPPPQKNKQNKNVEWNSCGFSSLLLLLKLVHCGGRRESIRLEWFWSLHVGGIVGL